MRKLLAFYGIAVRKKQDAFVLWEWLPARIKLHGEKTGWRGI